jgi:hypothetical protein
MSDLPPEPSVHRQLAATGFGRGSAKNSLLDSSELDITPLRRSEITKLSMIGSILANTLLNVFHMTKPLTFKFLRYDFIETDFSRSILVDLSFFNNVSEILSHF